MQKCTSGKKTEQMSLLSSKRNYRPASLTLISGKMMKELILKTISRHVKHKKSHKEWSATGFSSTLNFKNRARNLNLFRREIRKKFSYFLTGQMGETGPLGANLYCGCDSKWSETCTKCSTQCKKSSTAGGKYTVQFIFHSS